MRDNLPAATKRLVGYYEAGDIGPKKYLVSDIPGGLLSHVIYAFATVTAAGDCVSVNAKDDGINFPLLASLKAKYVRLGVLISIGGANHSTNFAAVAADDGLLAQFVQSSVQFMTQNGFDGSISIGNSLGPTIARTSPDSYRNSGTNWTLKAPPTAGTIN